MERTTGVTEARQILGINFIGVDELSLIAGKIGILVPESCPEIPFSREELEEKKLDYILILGVTKLKNGEQMNLLKLRNHFGMFPEISEPCFYNQDWYIKESFACDCTIESKWYLIRKEVISDTRGKDIDNSTQKPAYQLPAALVCAFCFFSYYFLTSHYLWKYDFIWCSDHDSNGDRIYVARYYDKSGFSKNGFSIHRHLKIKENYGCIAVF